MVIFMLHVEMVLILQYHVNNCDKQAKFYHAFLHTGSVPFFCFDPRKGEQKMLGNWS